MTRTFIIVALLTVLIPAAIGASQRTYDAPESGSVIYLDVVDGDTFYASILNWPDIIGDSIRIRIAGINCNELRGSHDSTYQARAEEATAFSRSKLENAKVLTLANIRRDKYFRILADVYVDGKDLGSMLLSKRLAVKWDRSLDTVFATPSGSRYHMEGCQHLARSKSVTSLTVEEAIANGLTPCKVCKPPGFDNETP